MANTDVDRLSDLANTASDLARRSNLLTDHAEAAKAHYAAYKAAKGGSSQRPSLCSSHLEQAARHDKVANDPESYAQKDVLARAADRKSDREESAEAHEGAAKAHDAAAAAYRKENPSKNGVDGGSDPWELRSHVSASQRHRESADFLKKKGNVVSLSAATTGEDSASTEA